jgi:ankyrin repeat protein
MQDFSKLIEKAQPPVKEPNPAHGLRIIFSSTAYPAQDPFPRAYIQMDDKNGPNLRKYLEEQLSNIDFNTKQLVASKAGPSFISARLIVNHIKLFGPMQSSLIQQPSPTPAPVSFLLGAYFQDMKQQGNKSLISLLNWCCLSSRPLTLSELRIALALSTVPKIVAIKDIAAAESFTRYASDENFQSWIKTTSWGLLETATVGGQKVVKTMHGSVATFFVAKGLDILSYGSQTPEIPVSHLQNSHHSLTTCLIRYLALLTKEPKWESTIHTDSTLRLVKYAGANWSYHISGASLGKPEASKMLKLLEWPSDALLKVLIKLGQEDPALGDLQGTWIHIFAVHGHSHLLSVAVKKAGNEVMEAQDVQKRAPLHLAVLHGHSSVVKHLLKSGAKTGSRAVNGNTALNFALLQGHQSVLKPLLERDPTLISTVNDLSQTPLFSGAIRGNLSAIKLLLERDASSRALDKFNNSVLHHVAATDKSSILKLLLESGADLNWQNAEKRTPLHIAIAGDQSSAVKLLLERGCRADIPDSLGRRPLHEAATSGSKSCTQLLLKQKVTLEGKDNDGQTALVHAVQGRHVSIVKLLLENKADVNVKDKAGFTVLMIAVKACQEKIAKLLLEGDQDLNRLSHEGHTVAFYAVLRGKAVSLLSTEEQSIASLLFRRYQKKYPVWNTEWRECQRAFLAEHGKKKDEAISSKLKSKVKSNEFPSSTQTTKPPKQHKPKKTLKETGTVANIGVKKVSSSAAPGHQSVARHEQQTKPAAQPMVVAKNQPQMVANAYPTHAPNSVATKSTSGVQERQTPSTNTSAMPAKPQAREVQQNSSIKPYQTTQMSSGYAGGTGVSMGGVTSKSSQVYQSQSVASPGPKGPIVQRNSWDIYSSLSASSTPNQTTQAQTHSTYATYSSAPQRPSGDSFKPFQPFQPNAPHAGFPAGSKPSAGQSGSRYSLPSQGSWEQPKVTGRSYPTA